MTKIKNGHLQKYIQQSDNIVQNVNIFRNVFYDSQKFCRCECKAGVKATSSRLGLRAFLCTFVPVKKTGLIAFLLCLLVGACQDPYREPDVPDVAECFLQVQTEPFSQPGVAFYWTAYDTLAVYTEAHNTAEPFHLQSGLGKSSARFVGQTAGSPYIVLYPYWARRSEKMSGKELSFQFPGSQKYSTNGIGPESGPMVGVGEGTEIGLKNLFGIVQIPLTGNAHITGISLTTRSSLSLAGKASVKTDFADEPELNMLSGGSKTIYLSCPGVALREDEATPFLFALPPAGYRGGFTIEVDTYTGSETFEWNQDITLERSKVVTAPSFACESQGATGPENLPGNQIWYKSENGQLLQPNPRAFNADIVSNQYGEDGWGKIVFDAPVRIIKQEAFSYLRATDIRLPDCVEAIGEKAFYATAITEFRTPESLTQVDRDAFASCYSLTRFYGNWASADESSIILEGGKLVAYATGLIDGTVTLPEGAVSLADYLFFRDLNMKEVILPEGLETIGEFAFRLQPLLERVVFSSTVTTVGRHAFEYCPNLTSFEGQSTLIREGRALVDSEGWLVAVAGKDIADFVVPADANKLFSGAFVGLDQLKSITFTATLENLYSDAISDCRNLEFFYGPGTTEDHHGIVLNEDYLVKTTPILPEDYTVPESVRRIFWNVFEYNSTTRRLVIPDAVYFIGNYCFSGMTKLEILQLPASLEEIGAQAFRGCSKLEHLYLRSYSPPVYPKDGETSYFGHNGLTIHVPPGTEPYYKTASGWKEYSRYIREFKYEDLPEPEVYHSTDFSQDGKVKTLQKATEGQGINIVLMGDAFSDRQIRNGIYDNVMQQMADALLGEEPFASYPQLFNVYSVKVVSTTEGYAEDSGQALGTRFVGETEVTGDDDACMNYALRVVSRENMDNAVIVVAMNTTTYGGTCRMFISATGAGDGAGTGIAYVPLCPNETTFAQVVAHEAGGHAFGKLADEYSNIKGTITSSAKKIFTDRIPYGWFKNVDFTGDPSGVKWAHILQDSRYANEKVGCFEGACNYTQGAWRSSNESLMRYNEGGFNAPSREAIWFRMHRLAYGSSWEYSYEKFAAYDAKNRAAKATKAAKASLPPLPAPTVVPYSWQDSRKRNTQTRPTISPYRTKNVSPCNNCTEPCRTVGFHQGVRSRIRPQGSMMALTPVFPQRATQRRVSMARRRL